LPLFLHHASCSSSSSSCTSSSLFMSAGEAALARMEEAGEGVFIYLLHHLSFSSVSLCVQSWRQCISAQICGETFLSLTLLHSRALSDKRQGIQRGGCLASSTHHSSQY
jgi:hypothetical protein